jgi:hypothetical protein
MKIFNLHNSHEAQLFPLELYNSQQREYQPTAILSVEKLNDD